MSIIVGNTIIKVLHVNYKIDSEGKDEVGWIKLSGFMCSFRFSYINTSFINFEREEICTMFNAIFVGTPAITVRFTFIEKKNPFSELYFCPMSSPYPQILL